MNILKLIRNLNVARLFDRHEHKRIILPPLGFDVPRYPTDAEVAEAIHAIPRHRSTATYIIFNAAMATTAAPVKQPTGNVIRTMMQLKMATGYSGRIIEWGASFDASAAATPGQVELIETAQIGATALSTAYGATDIQAFGDPNATANTAGTGGVPFNLGTSASGFSTAAITEGSTTASRMADIQQLPPTGPYVKQWPLGREFTFGYWGSAQNYLRVRMTFGATVNATCYCVVEV
jgi:hypothetical protein